MSLTPPNEIECSQHGRSPYAFICIHLRTRQGLEFVASPACEHGPAQAWCLSCDEITVQERGWTDLATAAADWAIFCVECYRVTLQKHTFVAWVQDSGDPCDWSNLPAPNE